MGRIGPYLTIGSVGVVEVLSDAVLFHRFAGFDEELTDILAETENLDANEDRSSSTCFRSVGAIDPYTACLGVAEVVEVNLDEVSIHEAADLDEELVGWAPHPSFPHSMIMA